MQVIKRDGNHEKVAFDKILTRISRLCDGLDSSFIDPVEISIKVIDGLKNNITTVELDNLAAEIAASRITKHIDYDILAARITVSNLHKQTSSSFSEVMNNLNKQDVITTTINDIIQSNKQRLDDAIDHSRDYMFSYFGFKTLERSYLLKSNDKIVERPQYMLMRCAVEVHRNNIESVLDTYNAMSQKYFIHASPTLFNSGFERDQLASCFLIDIEEDSLEGIYNTLKVCALISKSSGGIGVAIHKIRAEGSYIKGSHGYSSGIIPMIKVFHGTARYVDQGSRRPGAFALYLEPWHADVYKFLDLKKNTGKDEVRARDLFFGLWIPDLFMKRVESNGDWSLMCPDECPGLYEVYGDEFDTLYTSYENQGKARRVVKAQALWSAIIDSQIETGGPYMLYKDSINRKSNQMNLGTIKSSNLCTEIVEFTSPDEVAVCNLASIGLPSYIDKTNNTFDFDLLKKMTKLITRNLNNVIDNSYYPVPQAKVSNKQHRPIGIGIQGLADVFIRLRMPFDSVEARLLNQQIFETIYYAALEASCELAKDQGVYSSYYESPAYYGLLQYDLWNVTPTNLWDWSLLKDKIVKHGLRNSLLVAPMPTATTSQILGFNECFEPMTSNIYSRRVTAGEFQIVNHYLVNDLQDLGLWNDTMRNDIIRNNGSIQDIASIPKHIKDIYRTVWEISQKSIIDMAADRGAFVDQSQSMNIFISEPNYAKLTSMHFYGWKKGLKTGMYYLRSAAAAKAIQFTIEAEKKKEDVTVEVCSKEEGCVMCSS